MSEKVSVTSVHRAGPNTFPHLHKCFFSEYIKRSTLRLFADESIIYREIHNINKTKPLQSDMDAAGKWAQDCLMHFHPDKCNILCITHQKNPNSV